jgi:hypothetical protein
MSKRLRSPPMRLDDVVGQIANENLTHGISSAESSLVVSIFLEEA